MATATPSPAPPSPVPIVLIRPTILRCLLQSLLALGIGILLGFHLELGILLLPLVLLYLAIVGVYGSFDPPFFWWSIIPACILGIVCITLDIAQQHLSFVARPYEILCIVMCFAITGGLFCYRLAVAHNPKKERKTGPIGLAFTLAFGSMLFCLVFTAVLPQWQYVEVHVSQDGLSATSLACLPYIVNDLVHEQHDSVYAVPLVLQKYPAIYCPADAPAQYAGKPTYYPHDVTVSIPVTLILTWSTLPPDADHVTVLVDS